MASNTLSTTNEREALDRFLGDNPELEELSARLAKFNAFRVLRIERAEIRHSNVLAWLLDPAGSHGLGRTVLRRMLSSILLDAGKNVDSVSAAHIELMDFSDVEIRREWRNIDLLVICHDETDRLVFLVENKLLSGEHSDQLRRYMNVARAEFPDYSIVPVYLTLQGDEPSEDAGEAGYIPWSHVQLLNTLELIGQQRRDQLTPDVAAFLGDYLSTLRGITMQDEELVDLCKRIYRKHREAIELIVEHGEVDEFAATIAEVLADHEELQPIGKAPTTWFVPRSLIGVVPKTAVSFGNWKESPTCVACWFSQNKNKGTISLVLETTKTDNAERGLELRRKLRDSGFKLTKKAFTLDATFSRFRKLNRPADLEDVDSIRENAEALLAKAKDDFKKLEKVCRSVFGPASG